MVIISFVILVLVFVGVSVDVYLLTNR